MKRLTLCLLVPLVLQAQQREARPRSGATPQAQAAPAKQEDLCTLDGQVLNATTGELLGKATLTLRRVDGQAGSARSYSASSNASGKFSISNIEPGKYRLSATRTGFVNAEYGARDYLQVGSTLSLDARQRMGELQFRMIPNGVITGHVVDEDGEPMAYVTVHVIRYPISQGKEHT